MKRSVRFLVTLSALLAFLVGGLAILALALFVAGTPRLAPLNPYYSFADWISEDTTATEITDTIDHLGNEATLLSAFFGIDDALPPLSRFFICPFAVGKDGMPVIFSHELDVGSVQAGDFRVVSKTGIEGSVACTTFLPAADKGELRTVLLVGEFGSVVDQPVSVEIVGNVLSADGSVNFKGVKVGVIPLENGPSISLAKTVPEAQWRAGDIATLGGRKRMSNRDQTCGSRHLARRHHQTGRKRGR